MCPAEVAHGVAVNQILKPAMMGGACQVACMEGVLCVTRGGGCSRPDGLESPTELVASADEMCVVHSGEARDEQMFLRRSLTQPIVSLTQCG